MLQCLERCRQEVCEKLKLQPSDIELSMGMSQDYEQAVRCTGSQAADCVSLQWCSVSSSTAAIARMSYAGGAIWSALTLMIWA